MEDVAPPFLLHFFLLSPTFLSFASHCLVAACGAIEWSECVLLHHIHSPQQYRLDCARRLNARTSLAADLLASSGAHLPLQQCPCLECRFCGLKDNEIKARICFINRQSAAPLIAHTQESSSIPRNSFDLLSRLSTASNAGSADRPRTFMEE